jgi:hypothetical protein
MVLKLEILIMLRNKKLRCLVIYIAIQTTYSSLEEVVPTTLPLQRRIRFMCSQYFKLVSRCKEIGPPY